VDETQEPDAQALAAIQERIDTSPFHTWAGIRLTSLGDGTAECTMEVQPHHLNPSEIAHGGAIASVADAAIGIAVRTRLRPGFTHVTAQLDVHYLGMVRAGGRLIGRGRSLHLGQRMGYGEADLVDDDEQLVARASATFVVLPPREP